jgi:hypothetical protein
MAGTHTIEPETRFSLVMIERLIGADARLRELEEAVEEATADRKSKSDELDSKRGESAETIDEVAAVLREDPTHELAGDLAGRFVEVVAELARRQEAYDLADRAERSARKRAADLRKRIGEIVREMGDGPTLPGFDDLDEGASPAWAIELADLVGTERAEKAELRELGLATLHDFHEATRTGSVRLLIEENRLGVDTFRELFEVAKAHAEARGLEWVARRPSKLDELAQAQEKAQETPAERRHPGAGEPGPEHEGTLLDLLDASPARKRPGRGRPSSKAVFGYVEAKVIEVAHARAVEREGEGSPFVVPYDEIRDELPDLIADHAGEGKALDKANIIDRASLLAGLVQLATIPDVKVYDAARRVLDGGFAEIGSSSLGALLDDLAETIEKAGSPWAFAALAGVFADDPALARDLLAISPRLAELAAKKKNDLATEGGE